VSEVVEQRDAVRDTEEDLVEVAQREGDVVTVGVPGQLVAAGHREGVSEVVEQRDIFKERVYERDIVLRSDRVRDTEVVFVKRFEVESDEVTVGVPGQLVAAGHKEGERVVVIEGDRVKEGEGERVVAAVTEP